MSEVDALNIVLPGDTIPVDKNDTTIVLGPGLTQREDDIAATKAGIVQHAQVGNKWWLLSNQKRYVPAVGESVLGTVITRLGEFYRVDIGAAHPAILSVLAFEGATKRNKPDLTLKTLVYCRVAMANGNMEAELECVNPTTSKADGFGELKDGFVIRCSLGLCRRLLDPNMPVLTLLGKHIPFELAVGMNGRVWINSNSTSDTILVANAVQNSEYLSTSECHAMVDQLLLNRTK